MSQVIELSRSTGPTSKGSITFGPAPTAGYCLALADADCGLSGLGVVHEILLAAERTRQNGEREKYVDGRVMEGLKLACLAMGSQAGDRLQLDAAPQHAAQVDEAAPSRCLVTSLHAVPGRAAHIGCSGLLRCDRGTDALDQPPAFRGRPRGTPSSPGCCGHPTGTAPSQRRC